MQFSETQPLLLDISNITLRINHEEFEQLCQDNPDMRLELTANGVWVASVLKVPLRAVPIKTSEI
jgi:Uma2 family endonuclease